MPDMEEVFRMSTQKVKQEPGALERQFKRRDRKNRNRKIGAIAVVGVIVVLALIAIVTLRPTSGETGVATNPVSSAPPGALGTNNFVDLETGQRTPASEEFAGARLMQVSPDGSMVAFNTCCTSDDRVWVANIDGTQKRAISPANLDGYAASWSPDGSTLVFQGRDAVTKNIGQLYLADVETGEVTKLTHLAPLVSGDWVVSADISPDGGSVMFHLPRGTSPEKWDLWTIPITGGTPTLLRENAGFASYGPDGTIAFLDHPEDRVGQGVWVMDADGSHARKLVGNGPLAWPRMSPDGTKVAYERAGNAEIVTVATGQVSEVTAGTQPAWVDDRTLIVG